MCSRAIIISNGKIVADCTPAELEAQSRLHNAVTIKLSQAYDLRSDLNGISGIAEVSQDPENELAYTILASDAKSIFPQVSEVARDKQWPIDEFHINRGQLEDLFRTVTTQAGAR